MRSITRRDLTRLIGEGHGVVLVDHQASGREQPSVLHAVTCRWPAKTKANTPLRFAGSAAEAIRWLRNEYGGEGDIWKRCGECGGNGAGRATTSRTTPRPGGAATAGNGRDEEISPTRSAGDLVWTTDRGRDLGFVARSTTDGVEIAAFDSPSHVEINSRVVKPRGDISQFLPEVGDRCFVESLGDWQPATCVEKPEERSDTVSVQLESERSARQVPLASVRLRRLGPLLDPLSEFGEHRAGDATGFRVRSSFLDTYAQIAEPGRGLGGVVSSSVDLHAHQVGVARRVLSDPVQRYLLADEVGLGKTIEAGFVIRQRLIDAPRSLIVVLVPSALQWQWEMELDSKFSLREVRSGGVEISSYDDERAFQRRITPDLVVIDEAHRIAAGWGSSARELAQRFEAARDLARRVPRLLLLSATPVLHREHDLLAMLHLLDPDTYRLEHIERFRQRVRDREQIGELFLALRPGVPGFLLASRLPELREAFDHDSRMSEILDRVEDAIDDEGPERERALADARSHISESYRLHRRLLRNRRAAIATTAFRVRGRGGLTIVDDDDPRRPAVDDWLERWRTTLLADAHEFGSEENFLEPASRVFQAFAAAATGDPEALRDLVYYRSTVRRGYRLAAGLTPEAAEPLRKAFPASDAQRAVLSELTAILGDEATERDRRADRIADLLTEGSEGAHVVFTTAPGTIDALTASLADRGVTEVYSYTSAMSLADRRPTVVSFLEGRGTRYLLCDAAGEEGLNLQVADHVVHLDLPFSTTRLEQRIGRIDRHGDGPPIGSTVLRPGPAGGYGMWWLAALRDSFRVFETTTAPVQYAIETVERDLLMRVFMDGVEAAEAELPRIEQEVAAEQARIDKLDTLDALARQESDDVEFVSAVAASEEALADEFAQQVSRSLKAHKVGLGATVSKRLEGGVDVSFERRPPALRVYSGVAVNPIDATHDRRAAVTADHMSLLRPGAPLVEALRLHMDWDERTQTAAVWEQASDLHEIQVGIRCDFLVQADAGPAFAEWARLEGERPREAAAARTDADAPLAIAAIQRRLDAYLAPTTVRLWLDPSGQQVTDQEMIDDLEGTLRADPRRWPHDGWQRLTELLGVVSLMDVMDVVKQAAETEASTAPRLQQAASVATSRAIAEWEDFERLLKLRASVSLDARSARRDLQTEREIRKRLVAALRRPAAHWSGACLVVRSSEG